MAPGPGRGKASATASSSMAGGGATGGIKGGGHSNPLATQTDDAKYRTKYKELKAKVNQVEEDNTRLQIKILKSKKAIQRLRLERSILYDRLQTTTIPTNPFSLKTVPHLSSLNSSSSTSTSAVPPPNILEIPSTYTLANPNAPSIYLEGLNARKLAHLTNDVESGERANEGIKIEGGDLNEAVVVEKVGNGTTAHQEVEMLPPVIEGERMQVDS